MKKTTLLLAAGIASVSVSARADLDLAQAYQAALKRSETIADQQDLIDQAEEHYKQAFGGVLPAINGVATAFYQPAPGSAIGSQVSPSYQPLVKLTLSQPLFRGLREYAGIRQTKDLTDAQRQAKAAAELQLFNDTATNFYNVMAFEQDLKILKDETSLYQKRIKELEERTRIGRSRITETLTVEASLAQLRAQIEVTHQQLAAAREALAFLTGLPNDTTLRDPSPLPSPPEPIESYLSHIDDRPDVRTAAVRVNAFEEGIAVARGAHLPSLDLFGNYYLDRFGINKDVNWDVSIGLTVPIYAGGTIQSKVREAASQEHESELALSRARRAADQEIRTNYDNVVIDRSQLDALVRARDVSERNYSAQSKDYRLGLVTNLDVLQALTSFQESVRALAREEFAARLNFAKLIASTGKLP